MNTAGRDRSSPGFVSLLRALFITPRTLGQGSRSRLSALCAVRLFVLSVWLSVSPSAFSSVPPPPPAPAPGDSLVIDQDAGTDGRGALFSVDATTGVRTLVSDFGNTAQGPAGIAPSGVVIAASGSILVIDFSAGTSGLGALFSVDPATGQRTLLSDFGNAAQGALGEDPSGVAIGPSGSILVTDVNAGTGSNGALFSVNATTGVRTLLSDFGNTAQGPLGGDPRGVAVAASGSILVIDQGAGTSNSGALFSVNATTGARTLLSDFGNAAQGALGAGPSGVAIGPSGSILVTDLSAGTDFRGALFSVAPATGARTLLSDFGNAAQGALGDNPAGVAIAASGGVLVIDIGTSGNEGALFSVNATTGARTLLSDFGNATQGALGENPSGVAVIPALPAGSLQFSAATFTIGEAGPQAAITVTRTGGSSGAVSATFATSNGTATAGSDYTATTTSVSFADGDTATKTVNVPITQDTTDEPDETVNLALTAPTGGATLGTPSTAVLTITDDDPTPTGSGSLQFSAATFSVNEAGGQAAITVTRTGGNTGAVSVIFRTSNGTAIAGQDYTGVINLVVSFANGETSKTVNVPILNDTLAENSEFLNLTLFQPSGGATLGAPNLATLTIADNDTTSGNLQFSAATYTVGEAGPQATITVTRGGGNAGAVSVTFSTSDGTAIAGSDYTAVTTPVNFGSGDSAPKTVTVPITQDQTDEPNETVNLALSSPTGGATLGAQSSAVLTITDDDPTQPGTAGTLQFSAATFSVGEAGGQATITVTRTGGSTGAVSVLFRTNNNTAIAGQDYTAVINRVVSFANGDTADKTVTVPITNDAADENNELVNLTLFQPSGGATLGAPASATLTIIDND